MSTVSMLDDENTNDELNPVMDLESIRIQKGYTIEYVANKLHLRARIIELIENCDYAALPGPVFIKGYIRAYAKLLDVLPDPYLSHFDNHYVSEKKPERALWQSKRESNKAEHAIRWITLLFGLGVMIAVGIWWQKNQENQQPVFAEKEVPTDLSLAQAAPEIKLSDLSKVQSLLNIHSEMSPAESSGD